MVAGTDIDGIIKRVKAAAMKDPSIINMLKAKGIFVQEPQPQGQLQQQAMSQGAQYLLKRLLLLCKVKMNQLLLLKVVFLVLLLLLLTRMRILPGFSAETGVTGMAPPLSGQNSSPCNA